MKKLSLLLALALLLSLAGCGSTDTGLLEGVTPAGAGDAADAAQPVAEFTAKLFNEAYDGGDALISPVSVLAAMAMTEAGARGETLAQMEEAFGVGISDEDLPNIKTVNDILEYIQSKQQ